MLEEKNQNPESNLILVKYQKKICNFPYILLMRLSDYE